MRLVWTAQVEGWFADALAMIGCWLRRCTRVLAQVATTQIADTIYRADGTPATGTVIVSWPAFTTAAGQAVPGGSTSAAIADGWSVERAAGAERGGDADQGASTRRCITWITEA